MTLPTVDPTFLHIVVWALLFGLGAYLLLTAQPLGRPQPDLRERLRRLDFDERIKMQIDRDDRPGVRPLFQTPALEAVLRPLVDDGGRLLRAALDRAGLSGGDELARRLATVRPGVEPAQFFGEKLMSGLVGFALFPLMNLAGVHPFGAWPVWAWLAGGFVGFLAPDWRLEAALARRRTALLLELPTILDLLCLAMSAGMSLEQALGHVARQSAGAVAQDLRQVGREVTLGRRSLEEAVEAMAERSGLEQLWTLASQLRSAHDQGLPLAQTLAAQADAVREAKRLAVIEEGGKATVRMLVPVALLILPVLFVVILYPAGIELVRLGG